MLNLFKMMIILSETQKDIYLSTESNLKDEKNIYNSDNFHIHRFLQ